VKKITSIGIILLMLSGSVAASKRLDAAIVPAPQDVADIQHVMDNFHHAVAAHDGQGVSTLFLNHGSTWVTVLSDKSFAEVKAKNAAAEKVHVSSYQNFSTFVSNTKSALDPHHDNIQIMSDGAVASVYFHFDFVIDGKVENHGDETWQLVKTPDGWRIVAITYSSNPGTA
jgi:ketosteroid isomerase-like protein